MGAAAAGVSYIKVPPSVLEVAFALPASQRRALLGAYCEYFATGEEPSVPKVLAVPFIAARQAADGIREAIIHGRKGGNPNLTKLAENKPEQVPKHGGNCSRLFSDEF